MNKPSPPSSKLSVVEQTLAILQLLAKISRPMGVNALARELGMAPSSCFKILKQLQEADFAVFDERTKCYSLGGGAVLLARRALDPANTFMLVRPMLEDFSSTYSVSIGFWRRIGRDRMVLAGFIETESMMRIHMSVGQRLPMFVGAVGRAFAAEMGLSREQLEQEFAKLRWQSPPDLDDYCRQVDACRRHGYALDENNFAPGVTTVATAFMDAQGMLGHGISAIRFSGHTPELETHAIGTALVSLTKTMSRTWLNTGQASQQTIAG